MPGRRRTVAVLVVVVLAAVAVAGTVAYLRLPAPQDRDVALPLRDATPEQVVAAYLDALDAHDCHTAEALMVEDDQDIARGWREDVADLSDVEVRDHRRENPRHSGHAPGDQVANVAVTFDLDWRLFHGSLEEGPTTWGYLLERTSSRDPWRIFDQGTG